MHSALFFLLSLSLSRVKSFCSFYLSSRQTFINLAHRFVCSLSLSFFSPGQYCVTFCSTYYLCPANYSLMEVKWEKVLSIICSPSLLHSTEVYSWQIFSSTLIFFSSVCLSLELLMLLPSPLLFFCSTALAALLYTMFNDTFCVTLVIDLLVPLFSLSLSFTLSLFHL